MLKILVFAPIPNASASTAITVKPGFLMSILKANRKSWKTEVILRVKQPCCQIFSCKISHLL